VDLDSKKVKPVKSSLQSRVIVCAGITTKNPRRKIAPKLGAASDVGFELEQT
jgi:hypothetical protein